jgi:RimJ/RimL family protein N-acetyltransferase
LTLTRENRVPPEGIARAREVLREEGARSLLMRVLGELGYRRLYVLARELDQPIIEQSVRIPITIDLLQKEEVSEYVGFRVIADDDEVIARMNEGHLCFVVRHEGRIIHTCWVSERYAFTTYLRLPIPMFPGDVYSYDSFTHPDYRGNNISPARAVYMFKFMHQAGFKRIVSAVMPDNYRSLRSLMKTGFHIFALLGYVKIGPWRRDFCRYINRSDRKG